MFLYGGGIIELILICLFGLFMLGLTIYKGVSSRTDNSSSQSTKTVGKSGGRPAPKIGSKGGYRDWSFF